MENQLAPTDSHLLVMSNSFLFTLTDLLDILGDAVISTDTNSVIKSWNRSAESLYGIPASSVLGRTLDRFIDFKLIHDTPYAVKRHLYSKGRWAGMMSVTKDDGEKLVLSVRVNAILDKERQVIGFLSVSHDVTTVYLRETRPLVESYNTELQYYHLINEIQDYAIILLDRSGNIENWNKGAEKIKGYKVNEIKGKNFRIFYTPEDQVANLPDKLLEEASRAGRTWHEGWRIRKDQSKFWGYVHIAAIRDQHGEVSSFIKITRDLTERKAAELKLVESEQRFRSIFNSTYQFTGLLSKEGILIEVNRTALDFAGIGLQDVIGKPFWECPWWKNAAQARKKIKIAIGQAAMGKFIRFEIEMTGKDNSRAVIDFSIKPMLNEMGEVVMLIPEARNITEIKALQQEVLALQEQRKGDIIKAILAAQERERAEISYELHDNVNQILAASLLHFDVCQREAPKDLVPYANSAYQQVQRAIDEIRMISRSLNPSILNEIGLIAAINDMAGVINAAGKTSIITCFDSFFDEDKVANELKICVFRILQELMSNALKLAHSTTITLAVSLLENEVDLLFNDNGVGLDVHRIKWGLGLRNIHNRVELFRGKIKLESEFGKGCSVHISIPLN